MILLSLLSRLAVADTLVLYIVPATREIDWSSPARLTRSTLSSTVRGTFQSSAMDLGHVAASLHCADQADRWVGMARRAKKESMGLVLWRGAGLGTLLHNFQGRLEDEADIQAWRVDHAPRGSLMEVALEITPQACGELHGFLDAYEASGNGNNYGLVNDPLSGEGSGCSAFAAALVHLAGRLEPDWKTEWFDTVYLPEELIGPHHRRLYTSPEQPRWPTEEADRVGVVRILTRGGQWAQPGDPSAVELSFFSPDRMFSWAQEMRGRVGQPGGPASAAGVRLTFPLEADTAAL